ncbi:hypothetical protein H6P81_014499 [Aristolochia fimbriata]|uniref:BZIP domain-containing protein n=1 Tax=Aristolochia fimbriata TaxID=158543 RepID=A0AAV7EIX0_ARIFI|nr:hypothetical protein H6P81_014499 [Aristolochia fimbriata]
MGNGEAGTSYKTEKAPSPMQEQTNYHGYPVWASIQAYYGSGLAMPPPPYFSSPIAPGHPPHPYLWGPQHIMPPNGSPYAAVYPHGVYAHPSMPVGHLPHAPGITSPAAITEHMASPVSVEKRAKSGNKDRNLMKKLKSNDGVPVSGYTGNAESASGGVSGSPSEECEQEDSSDGRSDGEGSDSKSKRGSEGMPVKEDVGNSDTQANSRHAAEGKISSIRQLATVPSPAVHGLEFTGSNNGKAKGAINVPLRAVIPACDSLPSECWGQDERELKRERRKQSNRESARRSRLRKQAETEQLAVKVDMLSAENLTLRAEINRLTENAQKLREENSHLLEKLENAQQGDGETGRERIEKKETAPVNIGNFLSRVNNTSLISRSNQRDGETRENSGKLHQLLEPNPRADAVAAG